jgi:hypothetical protein
MPSTKTDLMSGHELTDSARGSLASCFAVPRYPGIAWRRPLAAVLMLTAFGASSFFASCGHGSTSVAVAPAPTGIGKLAYVQDEDIWVKDLPDGTPQRITNHTEQPNARPEWSASGQWLSFLKGKQAGVMRSDGSNARFYDTDRLAWSPVADMLAYATLDSVVIEHADGSGRKTIARSHGDLGDEGWLSSPIWAADGARLAYIEMHMKTGIPPTRLYAGIWQVDSLGASMPTEIVNMGSPPRDGVGLLGWSRSGALFFWRDPSWTADLADGVTIEEVRPGNLGPPIALAPDNPVMLDDPTFWSRGSIFDTIAITDGAGRESWTHKRIAIISPGGGTLVDLTDADVSAIEPALSPDGQHIAYATAPDAGELTGGDSDGKPAKAALAQRKVWVMDTGGVNGGFGANKRQLTFDDAYRDEFPQWSADGSQILFARLDAQDRWSLWTMSSSGGAPLEVVADVSSNILGSTAPAWLGYYGVAAWHNVMAWWRGAPGATATVVDTPLAPRSAVAAFNEDGSEITFLNPDTGSTLGHVTAGYRPSVVVRSSADQVLISQAFGPGPDAATPALKIFSLRDLTTPIGTLAMPDRATPIVYYPVMVLSADEQFLYYVKIRSSCPAGGDATSTSGGGSACDLPSIGVIDLNGDHEIGAAALPVGCSFPELTRVGASDALAICQTSSVILTRVSATGTAQEVARFPMRTDPRTTGPANPIIADLDGHGNYYVLYRDGVLLRSPDDPGTQLLKGPDDDIGFNTPSLTDTDLWVAAYGSGDSGAYNGLLVISRDNPSDVRTIQLAPPVVFVTAWRSSSVVLLRTGSSQAAIFDLTTQAATREDVEVPGGANVLASR